MPRISRDLVGLSVTLMGLACCAGQAGRAQEPLKDEAQCSPQELVDQFLQVQAHLDKPGELPRYLLGEPVFIHVETRNVSKRHLFKRIATAVDATRQGKPVPHTLSGQQGVERLEKGRRPLDRQRDRLISPSSEVSEPYQGVIFANLNCDMTINGEYEFKLRYRVRVVPIDPDSPSGTDPETSVIKEVRLPKPLRLKLEYRLYQLEALPTIIPAPENP